jgi:hypothetical protein
MITDRWPKRKTRGFNPNPRASPPRNPEPIEEPPAIPPEVPEPDGKPPPDSPGPDVPMREPPADDPKPMRAASRARRRLVEENSLYYG